MLKRLSLIMLASTLCAGLLAAPVSAEAMTEERKLEFLEAMCAGLERESRCAAFGKTYIGLSLDWMVFEACSFSGGRETMVTCFDRAAQMASEATGEPRYAKQLAFCHRFPEDSELDLVVRCYREGFKYSQEFIEDKYDHLNDQ